MSESDGKKFKMVSEAYQFLRAEHKKIIGSKAHSSNTWKYSDKKSNKYYDVKQQPRWGANPNDRSSKFDWGRYTHETENAYQEFWKYYEQTFWDYYEKAHSEATRIDDELTEEEKEVPISVSVDPGRCIACCSCETIAPTVFQVDKKVRVNPKSHVINEAGAKSGKILDAAQTCPTKAISVLEKESQRRLYPW